MVKHYNPNPTCKFFKSGKPKNWYIDDSAVRAIAKIFDITWDAAYDKLCKVGLSLHDIPTSKQSISFILEANGFEFITLGKPKKGESRPSVKEFIDNLNNKNSMYVLNLADYFVTVIDGEIYDVSDECLKSSVYSYWIKR